jgi:hypothetical protein
MTAEDKFEQDYSWKGDSSGSKTLLRKRSLSSSVETKSVSGRSQVRSFANFGEIMAIYPKVPWDTFGVAPATALVPTCAIASTVIKVGKIEFDANNVCDASFTFWRNQDDGVPLTSEFSFSCKQDGSGFLAVRDKAEEIFKGLITDPFVNRQPSTKTAIAYRCSADAAVATN